MVKSVSKHLFQSKTIWFNLALLVLGITEAIENRLINGGTLTLMAIVNIVLRYITYKPLHLTKQNGGKK